MLCMYSMFAQSQATYKITFTSIWSQETHPHTTGSLPSNAHWSKLVGATHNKQATFFQLGALASPGIELIAETGVNDVFFAEVETEITNGNANAIINGPSLNTSAGTIAIDNFSTTDEFPLLTLASMIAPSPDWFIGLSNLSLLDSSGEWIEQISVDVYPYDAGTDSGTDYTSANMDTNPADPISNIQGITPFSNEIMGTITIDLLEVLNNTNFTENDFKIYPNPIQNYLNIESTQFISSIEMFNILGKKVLEMKNINKTSVTYNIENLSAGVYLMKVLDSNNGFEIRKIIKK